jgi:2-polyprenyl-3-methyl-5-hydroxy-6-metoxy-1,4-benzoquinol methylase
LIFVFRPLKNRLSIQGNQCLVVMENTENRIIESWALNAEAWVASIRKARIASRNLITNDAILKVIKSQHASLVLDAGCGEGWLTRALAGGEIEVIGFDGSAALIEAAKSSCSGMFKVMSYEEFVSSPLQVGRNFDAVVFNFALLSSNIVPILRAATAIMSEAGSVIIQTLHPFNIQEGESYASGWREEHFRGMGDEYRASMPWYFRTFSDWMAVVREAGLRVENMEEPLHPDTGRPASLVLVLRR